MQPNLDWIHTFSLKKHISFFYSLSGWCCFLLHDFFFQFQSLKPVPTLSPILAPDIVIKSTSCVTPQITKFMGPTWGPPGSCRPQMGPMLTPWTLLSGPWWQSWHYGKSSFQWYVKWISVCMGVCVSNINHIYHTVCIYIYADVNMEFSKLRLFYADRDYNMMPCSVFQLSII